MVVCRATHRIPRLSAAQSFPSASIITDLEELIQDCQKSEERAPAFHQNLSGQTLYNTNIII